MNYLAANQDHSILHEIKYNDILHCNIYRDEYLCKNSVVRRKKAAEGNLLPAISKQQEEKIRKNGSLVLTSPKDVVMYLTPYTPYKSLISTAKQRVFINCKAPNHQEDQ